MIVAYTHVDIRPPWGARFRVGLKSVLKSSWMIGVCAVRGGDVLELDVTSELAPGAFLEIELFGHRAFDSCWPLA